MGLRDRNLLCYDARLAMTMEQPSANRAQDVRRGSSGRTSASQLEDLLSVSQFAAMARVTPQAVRKMITEGRLRAAKVGQQHVIVRNELTRYLAQRR